MRHIDRRGDCKDWFFSVHKRKPEVLTQELYILGARCFAAKIGGKNDFFDITPEEYRTPEFYFALCLRNDTPVMEDIPESVLTTEFLISLLEEDSINIRCFTEAALERKTRMLGRGILKFWQIAVINNGYRIRDIPLNDERVEFFLANYGKDSNVYEAAFKDYYKEYICKKNFIPEFENQEEVYETMMNLSGQLLGMDFDSSIELSTDIIKGRINRQSMIPINNSVRVPCEYSKKYDGEEYLLEIYKKIGIQVLEENGHYYNITLPENLSIVKDNFGYMVKDSSGRMLLHYYDRGTFHDRAVAVDKIYINL